MNGNIKTSRHLWKFFFAATLVGLSVFLYEVDYVIFRDARSILFHCLTSIAFVPISVLLVTLVLEHLLEAQQKDNRMHKLNMVLGAFFSEVGNTLLKKFRAFLEETPQAAKSLQITTAWTAKDFLRARKELIRFDLKTDALKVDLISTRDFLANKRPFLLALLENPNLLEHERITDMLWAIFHLTEELLARTNLLRLSKNDTDHISGDIKRAYAQLLLEWLDYMQHLKNDYPYLFSLALRLNPFNATASAEIS